MNADILKDSPKPKDVLSRRRFVKLFLPVSLLLAGCYPSKNSEPTVETTTVQSEIKESVSTGFIMEENKTYVIRNYEGTQTKTIVVTTIKEDKTDGLPERNTSTVSIDGQEVCIFIKNLGDEWQGMAPIINFKSAEFPCTLDQRSRLPKLDVPGNWDYIEIKETDTIN